jgi:pimeloyl-ACP methyl ester carboxylesterase
VSTRSAWRTRIVHAAGVAVLAVTALAVTPAQAGPAPRLPIVFVHGNSGSVAQFETQFQRFASNGYPQELMFAYEYDTSGPDNTRAIAELEPFVDDVLARTGAAQVLLAAHSRGTTVSHAYLADPAHAAEVAKYVNLDGRSSATPPGGVPTLAVWGEWQSPPNPVRGVVGVIGGATNVYNRQFGHTETSTSAKTFADIYRFWFGEDPATTDVVPEPPGRVEVAGRAVLFPQNVGYAGTTLDVWEVDPATGQRSKSRPEASYAIDQTGAFGPLRVHGQKTYEFVLTREDGSVHHFYQQPFASDDHFLRLNTGRPGAGLEAFTKHDDRHVNLTFVRGRELWGDQPDSDVLTVDLLGDGTPALNVLTPGVAPRTGPGGPNGNTGEVNALFLTDVGARTATGYADPDQLTDLDKGQLFPFNNLTFLAAADVFVPADQSAAATVRLTMLPRGGGAPDVVNVPNWPSTDHRITITFRDYLRDRYSLGHYQRALLGS